MFPSIFGENYSRLAKKFTNLFVLLLSGVKNRRVLILYILSRFLDGHICATNDLSPR